MKRKLGFTIVEAVVVMAIIGVLAMFGIKSFKKGVDTKYLAYSQAYLMTKTIAYNVFLVKHNNFGLDDGKNYSSKGLCTNFGLFANSSDNDNLIKENCKNSVDINTEDFKGKDPGYIASNGMRFWFTEPIQSTGQQDSFGNDINRRFWVVFTDIDNANKNDIIGEDIVPFYVTQYGETIPAGAPLEDSSLLKVEVQISRLKSDDNNFNSAIKSSIQADNFIDAKRLAWGNTIWAGNPMSYDFSKFFSLGNVPEWASIGQIQDINQCREPQDIKTASQGVLDTGEESFQCETCEYNCQIAVLNKKTKM